MQIIGIIGTVCAMGLMLLILSQVKRLDSYMLQKRNKNVSRINDNPDSVEKISIQEEMIKNLEERIKTQNEIIESQNRIIKLMEEKIDLYENQKKLI